MAPTSSSFLFFVSVAFVVAHLIRIPFSSFPLSLNYGYQQRTSASDKSNLKWLNSSSSCHILLVFHLRSDGRLLEPPFHSYIKHFWKAHHQSICVNWFFHLVITFGNSKRISINKYSFSSSSSSLASKRLNANILHELYLFYQPPPHHPLTVNEYYWQ